MNGQDIITASTVKKGGRNRATGISVSVEGIEELVKAFNSIASDDTIYKLAEPSARAAEVIAAKARSKINTQPGAPDLADAIIVRKPGRSRGHATQIFARVGFSQKAGDGGGGYYGAAVELGHRLISHGKEIGTVKEHPFLRPAADESREQVADILTAAMNEIIEEAMSK